MEQTIDIGTISLTSHADVLMGSSRVLAPFGGTGARDEPLRPSG